MPNTEEQRLDIIENCTILLDTVLNSFAQTDDTPEGRMVAQLKWLKESAESHVLTLPVDPVMLSTLRRVYVDGELCRHASSPDKIHEEIEIYMDRLIELTKKAALLLKVEYYPYALRCIDALIKILKTANRPLDKYEQGLIGELMQIKKALDDLKIEPPLKGFLPDYPNFRKVYSITGSSTEDLPNGKHLTKLVAHLLFEGVRPDTWITLKAAEKETVTL